VPDAILLLLSMPATVRGCVRRRQTPPCLPPRRGTARHTLAGKKWSRTHAAQSVRPFGRTRVPDPFFAADPLLQLSQTRIIPSAPGSKSRVVCPSDYHIVRAARTS
jgi:hypothetical protein